MLPVRRPRFSPGQKPHGGIVANIGSPLLHRAAGFWPMHEGGGKLITDVIGNNHGVPTSQVVWNGDHVSFSGATGEFINCGDVMDLTGDQLYVAVRARVENYPTSYGHYLQSKGHPWDTSDGYAGPYLWSNGNTYFEIHAGGVVQPSISSPSDNDWHWFEGIYDGANVWLSIDGDDGSKQTASGNITSSASLYRIGGRQDINETWDGDISHVLVLERAPSIDERVLIRSELFRTLRRSTRRRWFPIPSTGNVLIASDPISGSGLLSGSHVIAVDKTASTIGSTGTLQGGVSTVTVVLITADPISSSGSLPANSVISVDKIADAISAAGSLSGSPFISVDQLAAAISSVGSLLGTVQAGAGVVIIADTILTSGSLIGSSVVSVDQLAAAISSAGSIDGTSILSVDQLAAAISSVGSLLGTVQAGAGVNIMAAAIGAIGTLSGQSTIAVDITAQILNAAGDLLGTVQVTSPGNVLITADPISGAGILQGGPVIDIDKAGVISATVQLAGSGAIGLVLQVQPIGATGSLGGGYRIGVDISAGVIEAAGTLTGQVVQNVLQAAAAISASGQISGAAQVVGPGQLGSITNPGIISKTPLYAIVSVTSRRSVIH